MFCSEFYSANVCSNNSCGCICFSINYNFWKAMSNGSNKTAEELLPQREREEQIRLAAYKLWEAKGKQHGSDQEDWAEAESSINENSEE